MGRHRALASRALGTAAMLASLLGAPAGLASGAATPGAERSVRGDWRGARWGMSVEEVLAAFPGEARRLDPEVRLQDGNAVSVAIDGHRVAGQEVQVRFVFAQGKLALVSSRTPPSRYASADLYEELRKHLAAELGGPGEATRDDNLVDMRQTRWQLARSLVDLKYIPGVVVLQYHPRTTADHAAPAARP